MPVPTLISQLSQTPASNSPDGAVDTPSSLDNYQRAHAAFIAMHRDGAGFTQEQTVASAATADIGAATSFYIQISGTTTITSFGTNYNGPRFLRFFGAVTLTNSSSLVLPGGASITTAADDSAVVVPNGNPAVGWRVVSFQRAALAPGVATTAGNITGVAAIANGGTGQTTAALAFDALKQAATSSATGVVELATNAEAAAGTDTARAITPAGLFGGLNATGSAPIYACRAFVNFDASRDASGATNSSNTNRFIRASGNVASVLKGSTGLYTITFTTAMPDADYTAVCSQLGQTANVIVNGDSNTAPTTAALVIGARSTSTTALVDPTTVTVAVFR